MGNIIVANIASLDGDYEGPGKNVMMLPMDGAFDAFNLEHMKNAKVILLGGNSYKFFGAFWPLMAANPEASKTNREFATRYNDIPKVVVSTSVTAADFPKAWKDSTCVISEDVYAELQKLKENTDGDIVIFASRQLWNDLLAHGLVDELHFVVGNVVLGKDGTALFDKPIAYNDPTIGLRLLDATPCEDSSNHAVRYAVTYNK